MMTDKTPFTACAPQGGMTLIEILVAIVVLSVGLLGLAGLQLKGLQVNQGSTYRSQAAILVEDIADRMRADRAAAIGGSYTTLASAKTAPSGAPAALIEWFARLSMLPGSTATIGPVGAPTATGSVSIPITVNWVDTRAESGSGLSATSPTGTGFQTLGSYTVTMEF